MLAVVVCCLSDCDYQRVSVMTTVYRRNMLMLVLCAVLLCPPPSSCHSHDHHQHEHDERPGFKYSREANQPVDNHVYEHGNAHQHDHAHHRGHDHDHGHAHHHGHAHYHDHDHDDGSIHDYVHDHDYKHNNDHAHSHRHVHDDDHMHHHVDDAGDDARDKYSHDANEVVDDSSDDATVGQTVGDGRRSAADSGVTLWAISLGSTALISISPVIVLLLIPLENAREQQPLLKVLLSFASGGLLGDAFLHLIPHAIMSRASSSSDSHAHSHAHSHFHAHDDHGHSHDGHGHSHDDHGHSHDGHGHLHADDHNLTVGLWVLFGIVAFLAVEKFVRYVKGGDSHGHSHSGEHVSDNGHNPRHAGNDNKKKMEKMAAKKSSATVADDKKKTSHGTQGIDVMPTIFTHKGHNDILETVVVPIYTLIEGAVIGCLWQVWT